MALVTQPNKTIPASAEAFVLIQSITQQPSVRTAVAERRTISIFLLDRRFVRNRTPDDTVDRLPAQRESETDCPRINTAINKVFEPEESSSCCRTRLAAYSFPNPKAPAMSRRFRMSPLIHNPCRPGS